MIKQGASASNQAVMLDAVSNMEYIDLWTAFLCVNLCVKNFSNSAKTWTIVEI